MHNASNSRNEMILLDVVRGGTGCTVVAGTITVVAGGITGFAIKADAAFVGSVFIVNAVQESQPTPTPMNNNGAPFFIMMTGTTCQFRRATTAINVNQLKRM